VVGEKRQAVYHKRDKRRRRAYTDPAKANAETHDFTALIGTNCDILYLGLDPECNQA